MSLIRNKGIRLQMQEIEDKVDFDGHRSDGVDMACCVVARFLISKSESELTEQEILGSLSSEHELLNNVVLMKTFHGKKASGHRRGYSIVLTFKTKEAALEFADYRKVNKFKDSNMNVILLSNMVARKKFTNEAKDFEDDPAYTTADDSRRIIVATNVVNDRKNSPSHWASGFKDFKDCAAEDLWLSKAQAVSEKLGSYFKETSTGQWTEIFWDNSHF